MRIQLSPNWDSPLNYPIWLMVHTAQGATTDESLANYICNPATQVSYHYVIDDDSVTKCLEENQQAWAALGANRYAIHFCTTGFAEWSRDEWLRHPTMLNMLGDTMAEVGRRYGIDGEHLNANQIQDHIRGTLGHGDYTHATGDGNHTDPGPNFPWDYLAARMAGHMTLPPMQGSIREHYLNTPGLVGILGNPMPDTEFTTPDGSGRYTHFQRGSIYWRQATGAWAVYGAIRDAWAHTGWERGPLGYPVWADEFTGPRGLRISLFDHGYVVWDGKTANIWV